MYKLLNIDMNDVYGEMLCYEYPWPQLIVVDDLPHNRSIERLKAKNGNDFLQVKNSEDMVDRLFLEMHLPSKAVGEVKDYMRTNMDSQERMKWIYAVSIVSEMLHIECPQVLFCEWLNGEAGNFAENGLIILPDLNPEKKFANIEMLVTIVHELRHIWQYRYRPEWGKNYISGKVGDHIEAYCLQKCEIDAEAYARTFVGELINRNLLKHPNKKIENALVRYVTENELSPEMFPIDPLEWILKE